MSKQSDLDAFMAGLGYKLITSTKDHRTVERYEYHDPSLQNISKPLARHLLACTNKQIEAVLDRLHHEYYEVDEETLDTLIEAERNKLKEEE